MFLGQLVIGIGRAARGELLSANHLIRSAAAHTLIELVVACRTDAVDRERLDDLDPTRRVETVLPEIAGDIDAGLAQPALEAAGALLAIARRELASRIDAATDDAFAAVATLLDRVGRG